jgi:DNA polymerase III epsilon subunit-like protein
VGGVANEILISVDIETSGPSPSTGSLVAIGACRVDDPQQSFYRELRPIEGMPWDAAAERIHGLSHVHLEANGLEPRQAMREFDTWIRRVAGEGRPVFVGFNAPFDWMFVADYCHRLLGHNPFGISALDLKSLYMGRHAVRRWSETTMTAIGRQYPLDQGRPHHALDDARAQAALCQRLLRPDEAPGDSSGGGVAA